MPVIETLQEVTPTSHPVDDLRVARAVLNEAVALVATSRPVFKDRMIDSKTPTPEFQLAGRNLKRVGAALTGDRFDLEPSPTPRNLEKEEPDPYQPVLSRAARLLREGREAIDSDTSRIVGTLESWITRTYTHTIEGLRGDFSAIYIFGKANRGVHSRFAFSRPDTRGRLADALAGRGQFREALQILEPALEDMFLQRGEHGDGFHENEYYVEKGLIQARVAMLKSRSNSASDSDVRAELIAAQRTVEEYRDGDGREHYRTNGEFGGLSGSHSVVGIGLTRLGGEIIGFNKDIGRDILTEGSKLILECPQSRYDGLGVPDSSDQHSSYMYLAQLIRLVPSHLNSLRQAVGSLAQADFLDDAVNVMQGMPRAFSPVGDAEDYTDRPYWPAFFVYTHAATLAEAITDIAISKGLK